MKRFILYILLPPALSAPAHILLAQSRAGYTHMFRVYEDNDFFNIRGDGTDGAYTNGLRSDVFYIKNGPSRFIDKWMPRAGGGSINTFSWGIMQMIITPKDISKAIPDSNDYPYSGSLFAIHSLHSTNPVKRYSIQTELMLGVLGPPALAQETQTLFHRLVDNQLPMGWDHQLKTDVLLNINLMAEKELTGARLYEVIAGGELFAGTALNGASAYAVIRFGKMSPYFNGYISQYASGKTEKNRWKIYITIKPAVELVFRNAFIKGGVFTSKNDDTGNYQPAPESLKKVIGRIDYGLVVSYSKFSLSFTQQTMTPMIKGLGTHEVGNITLSVSW